MSDAELARAAAEIGYPLLVKAVAGGGGKGMRTVTSAADLADAVRAARSEAGAAFGDAAVYLERQLLRPRHIEVQLLGDQHGTVVPFVERECSIQRRHQKVVEETPSLAVTPALRGAMTSAAAAVARAVGYTNAGTIEFLLDEDGRVLLPRDEHPAAGRASGHRDGDRRRSRPVADPHRPRRAARRSIRAAVAHAARARRSNAASTPRIRTTISAVARPHPAPSRRRRARHPRRQRRGGRPRRADLLRSADLEAHRVGRGSADRRSRACGARSSEYLVTGIKTTVPFFAWLFAQPEFLEGRFHTTYLDEVLAARNGRPFVGA